MKIVIMNEGSDSYGPDAMSNSVCICDCILKDAKDGDDVKATIEGKLIEHEGKRYIAIHTVDGEAVEEMGPGYGSDMEEPPEDQMNMDAEDALASFLDKTRK